MAKNNPPIVRKPVKPFSKPEKLVELAVWINDYATQNGYPPTIQEMVDAGLASSTSVIRYYFDRMTEENMLRITPRISRGIVVTPIDDWNQRVKNSLENGLKFMGKEVQA